MGMNKQWACIAMLVLGMALAAGQAEDFTEAKGLIDAKVPCAQLSDEQIEMIGDYYMEQMHPGEAHALMEQMMGGEGSAQVKQAHIAIAERIYCNERAGTGYGMGMMGWGMGPGMMDNWGDAQDADSIGNQRGGGMMAYNYGMGMMGGYGGYWVLGALWSVLLLAALVLLVIWLWKQVRGGPLDALKERYAKGDISRKQFEEMKKELK